MSPTQKDPSTKKGFQINLEAIPGTNYKLVNISKGKKETSIMASNYEVDRIINLFGFLIEKS